MKQLSSLPRLACIALTFVLIDPMSGLCPAQANSFTKNSTLPRKMSCFIKAYPDLKARGLFDPKSRRFFLYVFGRERLIWDDGVGSKAHQKRLNEPDLQDTVEFRYPFGAPVKPPEKLADPGRSRMMAFLQAAYGVDRADVRRNLVRVHWMPGIADTYILFNERHGAAAALKRVSRDLSRLPVHLHKYVARTAGTFNWRKIAGTERLSSHAFGIAIDLNVQHTDYWRWTKPINGRYVFRNRIPIEIVRIFERHGFIWGGRWYHFDTMHFEYRPEFLQSECRGLKTDFR